MNTIMKFFFKSNESYQVNSNKLLKADPIQFPVRVIVVMFLCNRKY